MADIPLFTGTVPKRSQSKADFNTNIVNWLNYTTTIAPYINAAASEIIALSDIQAYSAVATYNYPDDVVRGSDGLTYQCVGVSVSGDNPVGSVTGNWVKVTLSEEDIADYVTKDNLFLNGNFDAWNIDTSQTTDGIGSDDHWYNGQSGSTCTHSQELFTVGQTTVPNNPKYYSSSDVTSVTGVSNYVRKSQRIPNVLLLSGKTVTLNFYGKADSATNIAIEAVQNFGDSGSAEITGIDVQTVAITTSWNQNTVQIDIPSVSGKTISGIGYTDIIFWFDAGSDFDARTNSIGQQSGVFDLSQVKIEIGSSFTGHNVEKTPVLVELWSGNVGDGVTVDWSATGYELSQFKLVILEADIDYNFNGAGLTTKLVRPSSIIGGGTRAVGIFRHTAAGTSNSFASMSLSDITESSLLVETSGDTFDSSFTGVYGIM